jgi:hypothetical protein
MDDSVEILSAREHMVAERYASGDTYRQVAEALCIVMYRSRYRALPHHIDLPQARSEE